MGQSTLGETLGEAASLGILEGDDASSLADPLDIFGSRALSARRRAEEAQLRAIEQARLDELAAREQAQGFFSPFAGVAEQALGLSSFLVDPQARFDFLQNDPLFQESLNQANQATMQQAAARGRISAGDTLSDLSRNTLLAAQPLLDRQSAGIGQLLGLGQGIATAQANAALGVGSNLSELSQQVGNVQAASAAAQMQQQQQQQQNAIGIASLIASFFSDSRLKKNAEKIGRQNGYDVWKWEWNETAKNKFGLEGSAKGVMVSDVLEKNPDAVTYQDGYAKVCYDMIGVEYAN